VLSHYPVISDTDVAYTVAQGKVVMIYNNNLQIHRMTRSQKVPSVTRQALTLKCLLLICQLQWNYWPGTNAGHQEQMFALD